jgi:alpha-beta hydrolase superfamily lysophospholipase
VRDESILSVGEQWRNGQAQEQGIYQLPEIEPISIYTEGDAVTLIHGGTALTHRFGSEREASEYAEGLRAELFEEYAAMADEALARFMRTAIGRRNG